MCHKGRYWLAKGCEMRLFALLCLFVNLSVYAQERAIDQLLPVRTESPQDTMKTFMESMNAYKKALDSGDDLAKDAAIDRASRLLDLRHVAPILRSETGRESAIFLKEVIDRVILIDYAYIPPGNKAGEFNGKRWRLKNTEITLVSIEDGERQGEFLFSKETVDRASTFFDLVQKFPYLKGSGMGAGYKKPWLQKMIPHSLKESLFGMYKWQYLGLFISIVSGLFIKKLIELIFNFITRFAVKTKSRFDDQLLNVVKKPVGYTVATGFWFLSLYVLRLDGMFLTVTTIIVQIAFSLSVVLLFYRLSDVFADYLAHFAKNSQLLLDDVLVTLLRRATRIFVILVGSLVALQNLGVNVMSVVAGLGLGGLAFALAAKDTAANLFGSLMILSDQPFKIGDWVKFSNVEGVVEDVGFRSTRVRTFYNSLVTIPNAVIANANIDNLGLRKRRRVKALLGLTYDTTPKKLEAFLEGVKNIILANPVTWKDSFHVVFNGYGNSALEILLYFFLEVDDWADELVQRQNIYLEIYHLADELGVSFAFPTQTLHIESLPNVEGSPETRIPQVSTEQLKALASSFAKGGANSAPGGQGIFVPPNRS
jgi:MscS family membrane protein